jgi:hypothetical protein
MGWSYARAEQEIADDIRGALRRVFETAAAEGISPERAAGPVAEEHLSAPGV